MPKRPITVASRRVLLALAVSSMTTFTATGVPAGAAGSGTTCTFEADVSAAPGLTTSPTSGTVHGDDKDSTITCDGPVNGQQPTGPGAMGLEGRYGTRDPDTCQGGGEGDGVHTITVPTSRGAEHIRNTFTYTYGAFKAGTPFSGTFQGDRYSGTFEVTPLDGDCASKPVTKFHVKGKGILNG
jgi:hypothetical protein